ncbi:MAG: hypothetical protein ACYCT3_04295 [Acidiferrobacter sp.]
MSIAPRQAQFGLPRTEVGTTDVVSPWYFTRVLWRALRPDARRLVPSLRDRGFPLPVEEARTDDGPSDRCFIIKSQGHWGSGRRHALPTRVFGGGLPALIIGT